MITQNQRAIFQERGLIRLDDFLPAEKVTHGRDVLLHALEQKGIWAEGIWHLDRLEPSTSVMAGSELVKGIKKSNAFRDLMTPKLGDAITELVDGRAVFPMMDRPQLMFTLPNAVRWTVPHNIWHLDMPRLPECGIPGVQVFTFLDRVEQGGGGTLVVAGSHRLLNTGEHIRSKHVKRRLKREPYFRDLMSKHALDRVRFMKEPGSVGDVELQVVELEGRPGDVYLVDMRMLHTLAPNASSVPRMMLTQRFLLEACREAIYGQSDDPDHE
jgi:hypothetical protein